METKDILENQPWTLIEDQLEDIEIKEASENEPKEKVNPAPPPTSTPINAEGNPFKYLAEDLGLEVPPGWDGDADDFKQLVIEDAKNSIVSNFEDPIVAGFINYITAGGSPTDFIQAMQTPSVNKLSPEETYVAYMKMTTNFNEEKINKIMERSKDLGDFDDEVAEYAEELKAAQDEHIQEMLKQQEENKKQRALAVRQAQEYRKRLVKSKEILGVPITRNGEFEKFYLTPSEKIEYEGKPYMVTAYQKRLLERQKDPVQYEALMAYLEFVNFSNSGGSAAPLKQKVDSDLKSKLSSYYGSTKSGTVTRLIDES